MKKLTQSLVLVSCAGGSLMAAPFLAIGDNAELFAVADASVSYNDNILLTNLGEISDTIFVLRPGFELQFGKDSLASGTVFIRETLSSYVDETEFNNQLFSIGSRLAYKPGGRVSLGGHASFEELDQTVKDTSSSSATDIRGTVSEREVTSAGINGEFAYSEKFSTGLGFEYAHVNYLDNNVDSTDYTVPVNVYYQLTPKVDLSAGVSFKHSDLDASAPAPDQYDDIYYNVGARGEFTPKLNGSFSLGYTTRDANRGDDPSGMLGASAALSYAYSEKTQFTLNAVRDFGNSSSNANTYRNTSVTLGAASALAADWIVNASLTGRRFDYEQGGNVDYIEASAGIGYTINQYLSTGLTYIHRYQNSEGSNGNDFGNNVVSLTLSARY